MSEKIVQLNEEVIKGQIKELVRGSMEETLTELLEAEAEKLTQAARYERSEERQGYRSGHYSGNLTTTSGDVTLNVPRLKGISFETAIIERYKVMMGGQIYSFIDAGKLPPIDQIPSLGDCACGTIKGRESDDDRICLMTSGMPIEDVAWSYDCYPRVKEMGLGTFHALRHTFASRALEQGMDEKTLSVLLGHYSVAFTLDTYAYVLNDHKWEGMNLMEELYSIHQTPPQNLAYPVIVTPGINGYTFSAPDFPELYFIAPTVEQGVSTTTQALKDAMATMQFPPYSSPVTEILLGPGQFMLQIPV